MVDIKQQLEEIPKTIVQLESKINSHKLTNEHLNSLQVKLDQLDKRIRVSDYELSQLNIVDMLELQTLIHFANHDISKAREFGLMALENLPKGADFESELIRNIVDTNENRSRKKTDTDIPQYYTVSFIRLLVLSILTLNTYLIYWSYKNWRAVQIDLRARGDKTVILPRVSAFFFPVTAYSLFSKVRESHIKLDLDPEKVRAGNYGLGVFLLNILCLSFIPVAKFQKIMNDLKSHAFGEEHIHKSISIGEVIFVPLFAFISWGYVYNISQNSDVINSPELQSAEAEYDSLTAKFEACSQTLTLKEKTVDTSSQSSVDSYNAEYDACEDIRIKQNAAADKYNALIK